jgi:glutamate carboxypeptidase
MIMNSTALRFFLLCCVCLPAWVSAQSAPPLVAIDTQLSDSEKQLVAWVAERKAAILDELAAHVNLNTGTENIAGLDAYRDRLADDLAALGFRNTVRSSSPIEILSCAGGSQPIADHLVASRKGKGRRLFLNGHMDTVFPADDEFQQLEILTDGTLKGPGVADMKGGIVIMLNALRALHAAGELEDRHITILLNSDEEIGSLGSRALIETLAKQHDLGLVFEGSNQNRLTRARKGLGQVRLKIIGRESHAGAAHEDGVSANLELARQVVEIEKLTDYELQSTVNVGVMGGGEKRNTIPGCADAHIDMRFTSTENGEALKEQILAISRQTGRQNSRYPELPKAESWAVLHRPAKPINAQVDRLIEQAMGLSQQIGEPILGGQYSGGGTDGSIAQAVGLPTLDSLGIDGDGAHSSRETATVDSLIARTQLAAVLISRLLAIHPE